MLFPGRCCGVGPRLLCFTDMFYLRWNSWRVGQASGPDVTLQTINPSLRLRTYSVTQTALDKIFPTHTSRRFLLVAFVKCIIWFLTRSENLDDWLQMHAIKRVSPRPVEILHSIAC